MYNSRANGIEFGEPPKVDDPEHTATTKRVKTDGNAAKAIANCLGVSRVAVYRYPNAERLA
jgi:DNA invertase Pin-like site-specific DNA recombinase